MAFIASAHAELRRQLGSAEPLAEHLAEASYGIVRALPASDWGYDGRTQQARREELEKARAKRRG